MMVDAERPIAGKVEREREREKKKRKRSERSSWRRRRVGRW